MDLSAGVLHAPAARHSDRLPDPDGTGEVVVGLGGGVTTDQIVTQAIPNEGIQRSLRNALISFLIRLHNAQL